MADIVDAATRSRFMSGIRGTNTRPEILIRSLLHGMGFRYRLHVRSLPGKPDIVLPRYRAVVFIHGCFWHGHDCHLYRIPGTRRDFWLNKVSCNERNDAKAETALKADQWRVAIIWECALRGRCRLRPEDMARSLRKWLTGKQATLTLRGTG